MVVKLKHLLIFLAATLLINLEAVSQQMPDSTYERLKKEFALWDQKSAIQLFQKGMLKNLRTYRKRMDGDISPGARYCLKNRRKIKPFLIPYAVFDSSILRWDSSKHIASALHIRPDIPFHKAFLFIDSVYVGDCPGFVPAKIPDVSYKWVNSLIPINFHYDPFKKKIIRPKTNKNQNEPDSVILRDEKLISNLRRADFYFNTDCEKFPALLIHFNIGKELKIGHIYHHSQTFPDATSNYLEYLRKDGVLELFDTHRKSQCELMIEERNRIKTISPVKLTNPLNDSLDIMQRIKKYLKNE